MFFLALPRPRGFLCQKRGNFPLFFSLWKAKMPTFFKLNREPLSEGKEARYAVCTGYEEKSIHSSNILLRRQWRLSLLPFFLPSFLQGPQIALTDGIYRQRRRRHRIRRERRQKREKDDRKRGHFLFYFFFFLFFFFTDSEKQSAQISSLSKLHSGFAQTRPGSSPSRDALPAPISPAGPLRQSGR